MESCRRHLPGLCLNRTLYRPIRQESRNFRQTLSQKLLCQSWPDGVQSWVDPCMTLTNWSSNLVSGRKVSKHAPPQVCFSAPVLLSKKNDLPLSLRLLAKIVTSNANFSTSTSVGPTFELLNCDQTRGAAMVEVGSTPLHLMSQWEQIV